MDAWTAELSREALEELMRKAAYYKSLDETRERIRQESEPDPIEVAGTPYVPLVAEVRRLIAEDKLLNAATEFDDARFEKFCADEKSLGQSLFDLGGEKLMRFTIETYVPRELVRMFDMNFNGVGGWES